MHKGMNKLRKAIVKQELEEVWGEKWEDINTEMQGGVNPNAFRYGFLAGAKWMEDKINSLKNE